jgi:hypothetical protein
MAPLSLVFALACAEPIELPENYQVVSDLSETNPKARDARIEGELRAQLIEAFGQCEAVFTAKTPLSPCTPKDFDPENPTLVMQKGYFEPNYHLGDWCFAEYDGNGKTDSAAVRAYCRDFMSGPQWGGHIPERATERLPLEEGLRADYPSYSVR